ncbi:MAG: serine/threonine-protein kinase [Xenococcaceae cyanobacterium]
MRQVQVQRSKYRILGLIGHGQFGQVFCAVHRQTGELVALKHLPRQQFPTNRFLRELRFLVTLQHPNIVTCKALEHDETGRYLVMDYCEGGTLRDLMESNGQLSLVQSLKLIADILLGLEHAHSRNIVHCDLKPENILLNLETTGWVARISDFGLARLSQEKGGTGTGMGDTGSPAYMAPERFYSQYSYASDLYAVGVLLFELVVGQRPFSGTPSELMYAHLNQPVEIPDTVPSLLRSAISTALQKLPNRRFACAGEMLKSIQLAAEGLAVRQSPTLLQKTLAPSSCLLRSIRQEPLPTPVTCLAVESQQVYLGMTDQICCQSYADFCWTGDIVHQWQVQLDAPLVKLSLRPQGCFALTKSHRTPLADYSIYCLPRTPTLSKLEAGDRCGFCLERFALLSVQSRELVSAIDPQGRWLAIAQVGMQSEPTSYRATFQILKLPGLQPVQPPVDYPFPSQLIALDSRHGLAIFSPNQAKETPSSGTVFRLFTRRGGFVYDFPLPIALHLVTPSPTSLYRFLAVEQGDRALGVLIDLKPFRVARIALDITPAFIVAREWGYILADRCGQVVLLNREGDRAGRFEVPNITSQITAIAAFGDYGLSIATSSDKQGILYRIDLRRDNR